MIAVTRPSKSFGQDRRYPSAEAKAFEAGTDVGTKDNTGCREREVYALQWDWEVEVPELDTSVFIIPDGIDKLTGDKA